MEGWPSHGMPYATYAAMCVCELLERARTSFVLFCGIWDAFIGSLAVWAGALGNKVKRALAKVLDDAARGLLGCLGVVDLKALVVVV